MRLYVWTDVLCDYTCGMIVSLAPDLDAAFAAVPDNEWWVREQMGASAPLVIDLAGDNVPVQTWFAKGGG